MTWRIAVLYQNTCKIKWLKAHTSRGAIRKTFFIFQWKNVLWILISSTLVKCFLWVSITLFHGEIRKISLMIGWQKTILSGVNTCRSSKTWNCYSLWQKQNLIYTSMCAWETYIVIMWTHVFVLKLAINLFWSYMYLFLVHRNLFINHFIIAWVWL